MFTHLYQRQHFTEAEVRIYGGEIVLALEHLHKVGLALPSGPLHPYPPAPALSWGVWERVCGIAWSACV